MKLTIRPTDELVGLDEPMPRRVWVGQSEDGTPVRVLVTAVDTQPELPSITCPKCGRTSYHATDIAHRFCATCGYHAEGRP